MKGINCSKITIIIAWQNKESAFSCTRALTGAKSWKCTARMNGHKWMISLEENWLNSRNLLLQIFAFSMISNANRTGVSS